MAHNGDSQQPFYLPNQQMDSFWKFLSEKLYDRKYGKNYQDQGATKNQKRNQNTIDETNQYDKAYASQRRMETIYRTKDGSYKKYSASVDPTHKGRFVQVPWNNLNIMDYARHRDFDFKHLDEPGCEYLVHWGQNNNKRNFARVALNPVGYLNDQNQQGVDRDRNNKPIQVTGKGAYYSPDRANGGKVGNTNDSLINFIMMVNGYNSQRSAYVDLKNTVNQYGPNSRFDPLDKRLHLIRNSLDQSAPFGKQSRSLDIKEDRRYQVNQNQNANIGNPYELATKVAHRNLLNSPATLKFVEDKMHISRSQIDNFNIGVLPSLHDVGHDQLTRLLNRKHQYGMGINSRLTVMDKDGHYHDRLGGLLTEPVMKNGQMIALVGYNSKKQRNGIANNQKVLNYANNYGTPSPYGYNKNNRNHKFKDPGKDNNHLDAQGRRFARGYLSDKIGISRNLVNTMMDLDMIRVGYGHKGDSDALHKLLERSRNREKFIQNKDAYIDKYGKQAFNQKKVSLTASERDKKLESAGRTHPDYIEFPHKLENDATRGLTPDKQRTVGADRINFQPDQAGYNPFTDTDHPHQHTQVSNSMNNYGYNVSVGQKKQGRGRRLFVFESPEKLLSYMDMHIDELAHSQRPNDLLSIGGSAAKASTIDNFMHHKTDETGEKYDNVTLAPDNDFHGQQLVTMYTNKSRKQMPKDKLDQTFSVYVPPYKKDWKDVRKFYAENGLESTKLDDRKVKYNLGEFSNKVVRDRLKGCSPQAMEDYRHINKLAQGIYVDFENKGERLDIDVNNKTLDKINQSYDNIRDDDKSNHRNNSKIYHYFNTTIGESMSPFEINDGMNELLKNQQLNNRFDRERDNPDYDTKFRSQGQDSQVLGESAEESAKQARERTAEQKQSSQKSTSPDNPDSQKQAASDTKRHTSPVHKGKKKHKLLEGIDDNNILGSLRANYNQATDNQKLIDNQKAAAKKRQQQRDSLRKDHDRNRKGPQNDGPDHKGPKLS